MKQHKCHKQTNFGSHSTGLPVAFFINTWYILY